MAALAQDVIVDRYRILSHLGAGAMGEVWLAEDVGLGRKVALKILSETHRDNPEVRARFVREARAVAAISHPNVVQVFTTGDYDGRPFLAMEYLTGQDLASLVRERGPLDSRHAAEIVRDAARGLAAAARAGLIHRDVKPSNLMVVTSGETKVTDFGLAKPISPGEDPALTAHGVVVGTPDYIAPEQARGDAIDARVDVYALGCTLFFLLTGRPPYRKSVDDSEKYLRVVARHLRDPIPDPRLERPDVDDELAEIQMTMMAKTADERFAYQQLIDRLDRVVARLSGLLPLGPGPSSMAIPDTRGLGTRDLGRAATDKPGGRRAEPTAITKLGMEANSLGDSVPGGRSRISGALVAVTVIAFLIFFTGLGLLLFGPMPGRAAPPAALIDAGVPPAPAPAPAPAPDAATLVEPAKPTPPGMLLVQDGAPVPFYVDRSPVTNAEYAQFRVKHTYAKKDADRPVVDVPYDYAVQYASFRGKRLPRADEWDAAVATPSFVLAGMKLVEWIDEGSGGVGSSAPRAVRGVNGLATRKKPTGDATTTFRLAKDAVSSE